MKWYAPLDITHVHGVWQFTRNEYSGISVAITPEALDWCNDHLGPRQIDLRYRTEQKFQGDRIGVTNFYVVTLRFTDEAKMVHFRLRWGGQPVCARA